jgi:hypothetical protein
MALTMVMTKDLKELIPLAERVVDQTGRRVLHDEKVLAAEKLFRSLSLIPTLSSSIAERPALATKSV